MSKSKLDEIKERNEKIAKELISLTNIMGNDEDLAEAIISELKRTHRTLIQSYFRVTKEVIETYADEFNSDLRNEASLKWAKEVKDRLGEHYLPLI